MFSNDLQPISGYVLAGGASSRLGRDKVLLPWNDWMGGTLLDHAVVRLQQVCATVSVCGNRSDLREYLPPSIEIIRDAIAGCGPLGGIVAALESSETQWNLLLAVDLPLIPVEFLQRLIATATDGRSSASQALCILPRVNDLPQPLCGLYRRSLASGLRSALEEGKYKIMYALQHAVEHNALQDPSAISVECEDDRSTRDAAQIVFLDINEAIPSPGPSRINPRDWFLNINTDADMLRARELLRASTSPAS